MKKILIITDALTQPLYNVRVNFLCNSLVEQGIKVTWISEKYQDIPFKINADFIQIPFYKHKGIIGKIEWVIKNVCSLCCDYKNNYFTKKILSLTKDTDFDLVFCSAFHTFGLKSAYYVAKKKNIPLHIDLRDIAEQCDINVYNKSKLSRLDVIGTIYRKININRRNKILKLADSISSVSQWHVDYIKQINPNTLLIYNGFDNQEFYFTPIKSNYFDIVYTGRWYGNEMQDTTLLFSALQEIVEKNLIDTSSIRLVWYTANNTHHEIIKTAEKFKLKHITYLYDYVERKFIPEILLRSSICLVLSSNDTQGIMTTKVYEAMGCEKPILCTNCSKSELHNIISDTNSGIATSNKDEVIDFILSQYKTWQTSNSTHANSVNINMFSRQHQTTLLINHLKSLYKK